MCGFTADLGPSAPQMNCGLGRASLSCLPSDSTPAKLHGTHLPFTAWPHRHGTALACLRRTRRVCQTIIIVTDTVLQHAPEMPCKTWYYSHSSQNLLLWLVWRLPACSGSSASSLGHSQEGATSDKTSFDLIKDDFCTTSFTTSSSFPDTNQV